MARWVFVAYSILFVLGEADTKRIVLLACWAFAASAEEIALEASCTKPKGAVGR